MNQLLSRRTVLRGIGASIALPWLEAMGPLESWVHANDRVPAAPNRLLWLYVPNGMAMPNWTPREEGPLRDLPPILQEVREFASDINILSGLSASAADRVRSGGHASSISAYLTGVALLETQGPNYRVGVSADQAAASRIGDQTRLASIEVGTEENTGYGDEVHVLYKGTMSWRTPTQPMIKEVRPRLVFERLFDGDGANRAERDALRRSILDYVREDSRALAGRLGAGDRRRLDDYMTAIRDLEQRIERAANFPRLERPNLAIEPGIPRDFQEHCRLLCDLIVLAFRADITRIGTFVLMNELSERSFPEHGIREGHHGITHQGVAGHPQLTLVNRLHLRQLAYLLGRLKSVQEGSGTLLDHCLVCYGSALSDGNGHSHRSLPILLAGNAGGTVRTGHHIRYTADTPLNNLWLSMLQRVDVRVPFLGDSTGALRGL
ncbi:MAG: DUF1552 domain-containing protein [Planctomycetes bacterium]|nr:DUF1552 domain-containing protein [Planctomycetota bacterium]